MTAKRRAKKPIEEQCLRVTSCNDKHYADKLANLCRDLGARPAQIVTLATQLFLDLGTLDIVTRLQRVEDTLAEFRSDFNDAVISDEE